MSGDRVKITDFGLSVMSARAKGQSGTPGFIAPEVNRGEYFDLKADVFSLGAVHHLIITKHYLYPDRLNKIPRWNFASPSMAR